MKSILAIMLVGVMSFSFTPQLQLIKTTLIVHVLDDLGNFQEGASVRLYKTESDYNEDKNFIGPEISDARGRVKFKKLEAIDYFVLVEKEKKNNVLGGERTGKLNEGKINNVNIIISE